MLYEGVEIAEHGPYGGSLRICVQTLLVFQRNDLNQITPILVVYGDEYIFTFTQVQMSRPQI